MAQISLTTFLFAFTLALVILRVLSKDKTELSLRLKKYTTSQMEKKRQNEDELSKPFVERVIRPFINVISNLASRFTSARSSQKLQQTLQLAGEPGNLRPQEYQALHYLLIILSVLVGWGLAGLARTPMLNRFTLALMAGVVAYMMGKAYLSSRIRNRNKQMQKELPDALDLLTVSVEAGLGFDTALLYVVQKSKGFLARELMITLNELKMGKPRRDALRDLAKRSNVDDLNSFVGAMVQADQLGVPITNILRTQSEQARLKRKQRIEEQAMKAPIKMVIPLVFFIFPSIFIVLLGSAAIHIYEVFTK